MSKTFKLKAAARLHARAQVDASPVKEELNRAMSLMLGKGLRVSISEEAGVAVITYKAPSLTHDIGTADLRRLETVMAAHRLQLSIAVSNNRLLFVFEVPKS